MLFPTPPFPEATEIIVGMGFPLLMGALEVGVPFVKNSLSWGQSYAHARDCD
jgi:hypothetical protein